MNHTTSTSVLAIAGVALLLLGGGAKAEDDNVPGRDLYRDYCKSCHSAESPNGEYTPVTLIQDQWTRFFDRKYRRKHDKVIDTAHGDKPVTEVITPELLEQIRNFAIEHAADSESPMTCG